MDHILSEKMLDMDFVSLDETHTAELLSTIRQNLDIGWGIYRVSVSYQKLCSSVLTILGGISLTVSLFISKVPDSSRSFAYLNNPLVVLSVIVLMLAITFIAPVLNNKSGSYFAKYADSHTFENRLFEFFGMLGYDRELATDVRMYRQDKICDRYYHNKEDLFGQTVCSHTWHMDRWDYMPQQELPYPLYLPVLYMLSCA